jgi:hypothetical protein
MIPYFGNADYCYANATAMLLAAGGENVAPSRIEALCGVGLGAFWIDGADLVFFSSLATSPDRGIAQALELLGFRFAEKWSQESAPPPLEALRADLAQGPALLGPLDAGFLRYDPLHSNLGGADHFVLAYGMDDREIHLHDPAGFPHVALSLEHLEPAWMAERIDYRRGFYRYWTAPQRCEQPTEDVIFNRALQSFKAGYEASERIVAHEPWAKNWAIGREAILRCTNQVRHGKVAPRLKTHLTRFMLKLSARRALDFASFLNPYAPALAALKCKQAELFGKSHTLAVRESWSSLADALQGLANLEDEFRTALLNHC